MTNDLKSLLLLLLSLYHDSFGLTHILVHYERAGWSSKTIKNWPSEEKVSRGLRQVRVKMRSSATSGEEWVGPIWGQLDSSVRLPRPDWLGKEGASSKVTVKGIPSPRQTIELAKWTVIEVVITGIVSP
jgi:hypothetical protein